MKKQLISILCLLLTAIIWGFAFVAQVNGVNYIGSFTLNGIRFTLGIISLLPVVLIFERGKTDSAEHKKTLIASLVAGIILFSASTFQQLGIALTESAGISGFITGLYTVLTPVACFLLFREKGGINVWLGALCAIVGLFMLCYKPGVGMHFGAGELLLLIGAFLWTAHLIVVDRMGKNLRSLHFAWGQFAVCAVLGIITMFIFETPDIGGILQAKWSLLYCGVLSVGVAYTLQIVAQKRANPTFAAIVLSTEAVFSAIGGVIFGIDSISILGYCGCALIFAGIIVSQIKFSKMEKITK